MHQGNVTAEAGRDLLEKNESVRGSGETEDGARGAEGRFSPPSGEEEGCHHQNGGDRKGQDHREASCRSGEEEEQDGKEYPRQSCSASGPKKGGRESSQ